MKISITWEVEDIKVDHPELTIDQCCIVLDYLKVNHEASVGINWDVIKQAVLDLKDYGRNFNIAKYRYSELSPEAKAMARQDYWMGANDYTRAKYTIEECGEFCEDTEDDTFYNIEGEVISND